MTSTKEQIDTIHLIGLDLGRKTSNKNGQSSIDGGNLWQRFEKENVAAKIPDKVSDTVYAVYYDYEGDHTRPFRYFIGCRVPANTTVPHGLDSLSIPGGTFKRITARGKMPDCIIDTWREIWSSDMARGYNYDFEIYDDRSKDWSNAEIDIYLS